MREDHSVLIAPPFKGSAELAFKKIRSIRAKCGSICAAHLSELPDSALLNRARLGDATAFGELSERCRVLLGRIARRILRDNSDAEDAVQEALLNAFVNLNKFAGRSKFSTWATRITINCCLMKLRKHRYFESCLDPEVIGEMVASLRDRPQDPEQIVTRDLEGKRLHAAIASLPKKFRIVVETKELQDRTVVEVASLLNLSEATTKARLFRAKRTLKRRLSPKQSKPFRSSMTFDGQLRELNKSPATSIRAVGVTHREGWLTLANLPK
jgi:RNA polymerase sigma-70 factor, ECF subfamily